jgi:site-specific DNA recombinase
MTNPTESRSEKRISKRPLLASPETPTESQIGLDFLAEERVNPEDLIGGTPTMQDLDAMITTAARPVLTSISGLEHLMVEPASARQAARPAAAVLYLRVSTARQTHTGADVDEDGNSIATQREHTLKKAKQLKALVVREFVEPGASARSIDKRPIFKDMLHFLDEHPEVTHVIAYQRSRMFRSVADSAIVETALAEQGVEIVSAKEDYGKGPDGMIMKTITDAFNQWQSQKNGEDISLKMAHKVEQGGTVGMAKLGYLNVRKEFGGHLVNTIDLDPVRGPLVKWAFERYATGELSVAQLREELIERGLEMRPTPTKLVRPISNNQLSVLLRDPYYTGITRYKGKLFAGRHQPLISKETFLAVQRILDSRNRQGDRDRVHFHYLRGLLYCAECARNGRNSRLVFTQSKGQGGIYEYYICTAKQRGHCTARAIRVDQIESHLIRVVEAEKMSRDFAESLRHRIVESFDDLKATDRDLKKALRQQSQKLRAAEERLIDALAEGSLPTEQIRARLQRVSLERQVAEEKLSRTTDRIEHGVQTMLGYLDLLQDPGQLFEVADDRARRELLLALFEKLLVEDVDGVEARGIRTSPNDAIHKAVAALPHAGGRENRIDPRGEAGVDGHDSLRGLHSPLSLNNTTLVGRMGLEPMTDGL